jgi:hypothetical protein
MPGLSIVSLYFLRKNANCAIPNLLVNIADVYNQAGRVRLTASSTQVRKYRSPSPAASSKGIESRLVGDKNGLWKIERSGIIW